MSSKNRSKQRPATADDLAKLIGKISPKRQDLIAPILQEPKRFVLLSMRKLASKLNCAPATVLRIAREMGFENFHDLRRYLHDLSVSQETSLDVMEQHGILRSGLLNQVRASLDRDQGNLRALRHSLDVSRTPDLAKRLHQANRILILAGDLAIGLAHFLEYNLNVIGLNASSASTPGEVVHRTRLLGRRDVVIAISFRRGLRQTVEGLRTARSKNAYCIGITDSMVSPVARFAHECFVTPSEGPIFSGSYTSAMALLNVILVACSNYRRSRTLTILKEADEEQRLGYRWYANTQTVSRRSQNDSGTQSKKR